MNLVVIHNEQVIKYFSSFFFCLWNGIPTWHRYKWITIFMFCIQEGPAISYNAQTTLKNFCQWQHSQNYPGGIHHDTAVLITRYLDFLFLLISFFFFGSVIGMGSYIPGSCHLYRLFEPVVALPCVLQNNFDHLSSLVTACQWHFLLSSVVITDIVSRYCQMSLRWEGQKHPWLRTINQGLER